MTSRNPDFIGPQRSCHLWLERVTAAEPGNIFRYLEMARLEPGKDFPFSDYNGISIHVEARKDGRFEIRLSREAKYNG